MDYYYRGKAIKTSSNRGRPRSEGHRSQNSASGSATARDGVDPRNVLEVRRNYGPAPVYETPQVLGGYSVDDERKFGHDRSMLNFLDTRFIPEDGKMSVRIDLQKGIDKVQNYTGTTNDSLQNFLRWILSNEKKLLREDCSDRLEADFVSMRRNFTRIMRSPYNFREEWTVYATMFKGTIYMMTWESEEARAARNDECFTPFSKWGHKFEQYMCGGNPEEVLNPNEEYRCVLKGMLDKTSLLFAPELDCADPGLYEEDFTDLSGFVLVKCCRELKEEHKKRNHRKFKLNQWWCENHIVGVPRIIVGYRNDDGIVHTLEKLETEDLPEMSQGDWDPNVCLNFLHKFLDFAKERIMSDPTAVFRFDRESKGNVYCTKLTDSSHKSLLPTWFMQYLFAQEDSEEEEEEEED